MDRQLCHDVDHCLSQEAAGGLFIIDPLDGTEGVLGEFAEVELHRGGDRELEVQKANDPASVPDGVANGEITMVEHRPCRRGRVEELAELGDEPVGLVSGQQPGHVECTYCCDGVSGRL